MSKLIDELELKFRNFDRKIEDKINSAENLCLEQQGFNVAHFNVISLTDNYSTELNNVRAEFWFYVSSKPTDYVPPRKLRRGKHGKRGNRGKRRKRKFFKFLGFVET
jgi:hypothetical protein